MIYDLEEKADSLNELMNHKALYRTAPATPSLLNIGATIRICQEILVSPVCRIFKCIKGSEVMTILQDKTNFPYIWIDN